MADAHVQTVIGGVQLEADREETATAPGAAAQERAIEGVVGVTGQPDLVLDRHVDAVTREKTLSHDEGAGPAGSGPVGQEIEFYHGGQMRSSGGGVPHPTVPSIAVPNGAPEDDGTDHLDPARSDRPVRTIEVITRDGGAPRAARWEDRVGTRKVMQREVHALRQNDLLRREQSEGEGDPHGTCEGSSEGAQATQSGVGTTLQPSTNLTRPCRSPVRKTPRCGGRSGARDDPGASPERVEG